MGDLATLDFETYFSDEYTLKKLTTEAYIRDPRFKTHCLGMTRGEHCGVLRGEWLTPESLVCLSQNALIAHHAHFDGLILSHHYGVKPAFWFDTLSMARLIFPHTRSLSLGNIAKKLGLPEKSVPYNEFKNFTMLPTELYNKVAAGCKLDVELTYAVFQTLIKYIPRSELRIIDLTVRMFTEPSLRLDRDTLNTYLRETKEEKDDLLAASGVTKDELNSAERFSALLTALGVEPPTKISKKTGKMSWAFAKTDKDFKGLLDCGIPAVETLVAARLEVKSNSVQTRAERMLDMDARGPMCVYLNVYGAHTLRWSGGDLMNWQNFKRGSALRAAVKAPPGYVVVVVDASQIEARLLDWLAGETEMLEKWARKEDIYSETASDFYGEPVDKSKPAMRGTGKQIILSCGFGAGAQSIQNTARLGTYGPPVILTIEQALAARDLYRSRHKKVVKMWWWAGTKLLEDFRCGRADYMWGPLQCHGQRLYAPGGAWIDYSNVHHNGEDYYQAMKRGVVKTYGGKMVQNAIELLSRTVLAENALKVAARYKVVTLTHDEIVYLAPIAEAQEALDFGLDIVKTPAPWATGLPLDAEGGYAANYSK